MRFCISAFKPPAALVEGDVIDLVTKQYLLIPRYVLGIPSALSGIDRPGGQTHALKVTLPHPHPHPAAIEPRDSTGLRRQKVTSATPFKVLKWKEMWKAGSLMTPCGVAANLSRLKMDRWSNLVEGIFLSS